jgi:predicted CoA-substrate-specific enzyme activase
VRLRLGIDVGAVSVKVAVLDERGRLVYGLHRPHLGRPAEALSRAFGELLGRGLSSFGAAAITGSGRWLIGGALGLPRVSEIRAQAEGALAADPAVRSVIEIGGQDSKLIRLAEGRARARIVEQAMNDLCAAGTGAFLERQAARLGLGLAAFGELAGSTNRVAAVAGRCAVFAQTDVSHLRRQGRPVAELAAGLCQALARNFLGCLARGRALEPPVSLQGGVAGNLGVREAFGRLLGLGANGLRVPEHYLLTGAIGAALCAGEGAALDIERALASLHGLTSAGDVPRLRALAAPEAPPPLLLSGVSGEPACFVGIDIGSVSAKVAVIDGRGRLLHAAYRPAGGEAAAEAHRLLDEVRSLGVRVRAVAVTGSGREPAARALRGAAFNEIGAQARAARELSPQARTIIEVGGQDAKLIGLGESGTLDFFEMNKVCAAGTGAFLEEQAARLGLAVEELGPLALRAERPPQLGSRCTVFMESDLIHHQQRGLAPEELAAGLCLAAAANYIEKVASGRELRGPVAFLGGLAANRGVVAALGQLIGQSVEVPSGHAVSGAIGAAHLLRDEAGRGVSISRLRGPDLFDLRRRLLFSGAGPASALAGGGAVGLPRALLCHQHFPFWRALFETLGVGLTVSPPTDAAILHLARRSALVETCLPVRLAYGHAAQLLASGADRLLLPVLKEEGPRHYRCPYIQAAPNLLAHRFGAERVISPVMPAVWTARSLVRALRPLATAIGAAQDRLKAAVELALATQEGFEACWRAKGAESVARAAPGGSVVVLARDYLISDAALGRGLPGILARCGLEPLPHALLPREAAPEALCQDIVWRRGRDYLLAAHWARERGLHVLMLTSFGCGPDSFVEKYLREMLGERLGVIELDEHVSRGALETRLEAFADLVRAARPKGREAFASTLPAPSPPPKRRARRLNDLRERVIYVPYAGEPFHALVAALRSVGLSAELLPAPNIRSEALGRRHTSGKECLPFLYHAGDLLTLAERPGLTARTSALFVPGNDESCRVSQFARALRLLAAGQGLAELLIFSPKVSMMSDEAVDWLGLRFGRRLWRGWVGVEALQRALLKVRPYEAAPGTAEAAYEHARGLLLGSAAGADYWRALREALGLIEAVARREALPRPLIAVTGDYYMRANEFANRALVRRIEALGGEVLMAPFFTDYLRFQARERPRLLRRAGRPLKWAGSLLRSAGLEGDYRRIAAASKTLDDPGPEECLESAAGLLGPELDRPPIASLGELAHYIERGAAGVVNPVPLGCLYGTIATSAALALLKDRRVPFLTLTYDGQEGTNLDNRIEAFMDQVSDQVLDQGRQR